MEPASKTIEQEAAETFSVLQSLFGGSPCSSTPSDSSGSSRASSTPSDSSESSCSSSSSSSSGPSRGSSSSNGSSGLPSVFQAIQSQRTWGCNMERPPTRTILADRPGRNDMNITAEEGLLCESIDHIIQRILKHHQPLKKGKKRAKKAHGTSQFTVVRGIEDYIPLDREPSRIIHMLLDSHEHRDLIPFLQGVPGVVCAQFWPCDIQFRVASGTKTLKKRKLGDRKTRAIHREEKEDEQHPSEEQQEDPDPEWQEEDEQKHEIKGSKKRKRPVPKRAEDDTYEEETLIYRAIERKAKKDYEAGHISGRLEVQTQSMAEHPLPKCRFHFLIETGPWVRLKPASGDKKGGERLDFGLTDLLISAEGRAVSGGFQVEISRSPLESVLRLLVKLYADLTYEFRYLDYIEAHKNPCLTSAPWDDGTFEYKFAKQEQHAIAPGVRCDTPRGWWLKSVAMVYGMGELNARGITSTYRTLKSLQRSYRALNTVGERENLLTHIETGGQRGIGGALSKKVYRFVESIDDKEDDDEQTSASQKKKSKKGKAERGRVAASQSISMHKSKKSKNN